MSSSKSKVRKEEASNPDSNLTSIGNYVFQKTVGEGNFAKVKLAKHKLTGAEVAVKIIDKSQLDEKKLSKLYREVRIMKLLHHPNIVKLYEVIETKYTVFLVMEYSSGGELYDYLVVHGKMKEKEARAKFRQILSAVSYCHKKKVIHRDLKAENLLLDVNLDIKIADFGFSNHFDPDSKLDTFCGSPPYAAPELFQGRKYTGPEVDIWSLGVILYVLCTGCLPFDGKNLQEMRESVCRGKYRIPFYLSDTCEKLLRKFLIRDPFKRSTLDMLIDDPWINEGYTDSPIDKDAGESVALDDEVIKMIETRFKLDREVILKSLNDGVYDDISAVYYLIHYEKQTRGKIEGEIQAMGSNPLSLTPSPTTIVSDLSGKELNKASIVPSSTRKTAKIPVTNNIPEDEVVEEVPLSNSGSSTGTSAARTVQKPKIKRRVTVGAGDSGNIENSAPIVAPAPLKKVVPQESDMNGHVTQSSSPTPGTVQIGASDNAGNQDTTGQRKRHNTIVGIFRNTIRRPSEVGPVSPSVPTPENKNNNIDALQEDAEDSGTNISPNEPRSLRFTFNSNSTSSKPPDDIVHEVSNVCIRQGVAIKLLSRYVLECTHVNPSGGENLKFEVEICKLPRLKNLHGLRFKRLTGSSSEYKEVCEKILDSVQL